jgi:hypothetical protein
MNQFFSRMGKKPSTDDVSSFGKQRDDLVNSLAKFNADSRKYLGIDAFDECIGWVTLSTEDYEDAWDPLDPPEPIPDQTRPECSAIALPSALLDRSPHRIPLARLLQREFELRKGHANDALSSIRKIIGQQAFQVKKVLRNAPDKVHRTRARTTYQAVQRELVLQCRIYMRTRRAMINLGLEPTMVSSKYQLLTRDDIRVSGAILEPNETGSTRSRLSWIWTTHQGIGEIGPTDNHLTECP